MVVIATTPAAVGVALGMMSRAAHTPNPKSGLTWAQHMERRAEFIALRKAFGTKFGLEHGNYQNGKMGKSQPRTSTPEEIAVWSIEQGAKMGVISSETTRQGMRLWRWWTERYDDNAWKVVPDKGVRP
jgi:hypothetical protein